MKYSRNSLSKVENLRIGSFKLVTELTHEIRHENTQKTCFSHKNNLKNFEKHGWYKSLPKANGKNKNLFGLIRIWLSTHTSHLNTYNYTNGIIIHSILDLCVLCVNQVWTSPWSSMMFQWSIQTSYTQLIRSQGTYLICRNKHIWPLTNVFTID